MSFGSLEFSVFGEHKVENLWFFLPEEISPEDVSAIREIDCL